MSHSSYTEYKCPFCRQTVKIKKYEKISSNNPILCAICYNTCQLKCISNCNCKDIICKSCIINIIHHHFSKTNTRRSSNYFRSFNSSFRPRSYNVDHSPRISTNFYPSYDDNIYSFYNDDNTYSFHNIWTRTEQCILRNVLSLCDWSYYSSNIINNRENAIIHIMNTERRRFNQRSIHNSFFNMHLQL